MSDIAKFTPGPWSISTENMQCNQIDAEHHAICTDQFCYAPKDEKAANAHLIAAAPELYGALVGLEGILATAESNASGNPEWEHVSKRISAARAALSKARGEA